MKKGVISKRFVDQHYSVFFNAETGFFARIEEKGYEEPFWAESGPELLDISITNYCERECSFCYRRSTKKGKTISLSEFAHVVSGAKSIGVLQIALGGGNPNQHPDFIDILRITSENNIVPSYTSNGVGLSDKILKATKDYCGALAISAYATFQDLPTLLKKISEFGIKTNIHFLLKKDTIHIALAWLQNPPDFMNYINAVIFLNYKPINSPHTLLAQHSPLIKDFFETISSKVYRFKIGFDSCSVSGISKFLNVNPIFFESCEAGRFSAFVSEELRMYPCSFMVNTEQYGDMRNESMRDIWQHNPHFVAHRNKIMHNNCKACIHEQNCKGGCVFLPEINLCQF